MKQELSVWSLIENNEFDYACEKAEQEFSTTKDILSLRNKIYALFHLRKYTDVISLSEKIIIYRQGETDSDFISLGIANWICGNITEAIKAWQQAQDSLYKDASGGIETQTLLYFAGIRAHENKLRINAIKTIKKLLKSKRSINWPGPIGHYLLNDIDEIELISSIAKIPIIKERQLCQAHFVLAIKKLEIGDVDGYYQKLEDTISHGPHSYLAQMYYLAKGELENR